MLENLDMPPPQRILQVAANYQADSRDHKMDLGIGVYRDENGNTAVLDVVKTAEERILKNQDSKSYLGLLGDVRFSEAVTELILGEHVDRARTAAIQTPGGSGALRLLFELIKLANTGATVWVPDPTWDNHLPTMLQAGLTVKVYPYFDRKSLEVDSTSMKQALEKIPSGDVVLFHGCCHNPTGASLSNDDWDAIADIALRRRFIPFIDFAYQGFGDGLDADAYGVRVLADRLPELLVTASCSKNFAIYRERTGLAMVISENAEISDRTLEQMKTLARVNHSMPPDHGAAIVKTVLEDDSLKRQWLGELESMRARMIRLRQALADAFRQKTGTDRYDFLARHRGMFSLLGVTPDQVEQLRDDYAIYLIDDSRMNIAGLREDRVDDLVNAVIEVGGLEA